MRWPIRLLLVGCLVVRAAVPAWADDRALFTAGELAAIAAHAAPRSAPADPTNRVADDPRAAALGQFLFFDRRLSANGRFSCASCHQPAKAFTDGRAVAQAIAAGTRNTPTLLNAADDQWFFWDGRADSMWAQVLQVVENQREFGGDRLAVAHTIDADPMLRRAYTTIFGALPALSDQKRFPAHGSPSAANAAWARSWNAMDDRDKDAVNRLFSNVGKAIAAYERRLRSRNSRFDRYARALRNGDAAGQSLLSAAEKRGLKLFVGKAQCELCHSGPDFSDGQFHNIGLPLLPGETADHGRENGIAALLKNPFNAAGPYSDDRQGQSAMRLKYLPEPASMRGAFKTPTLRNVALTSPYLHDGRFSTLRQVVTFYADDEALSADHLIGARERTLDLIPHLTAAEIEDLVAFLTSLNGAPAPEALAVKPDRP